MDKAILMPKLQFVLTGGASGYKLFVFDAGTTTKKTIYTTRACTVEQSNPITLDTYGMPSTNDVGIFCTGTYKLALYLPTETDPPTGDPVWSMDNLRVSYAASLSDADADTLVEVERTADGDIVYIKTGGTDRAQIDANGLHLIKALQLGETTAPTTAASYGAVYTKDENGQPELLYREESSGDSVELTKGGGVAVPTGHISGLIISNNVADANNDIDIATGVCSDSTGLVTMRLGTALTKKLDAAWAAGTDAGGLFSGAAAANTWYHVFLIRKDADGTLDAGFDTSVTAANKPAGYTKYRRIGSIQTAAATTNIKAIDTTELAGGAMEVLWDTPTLDFTSTNPGTDAVTRTLLVPTGYTVAAMLNAMTTHAAGNTVHTYFSCLAQSDVAPSAVAAPLASHGTTLAAGSTISGQVRVRTNTSGQVRTRCSVSDANTQIAGCTIGWIDERR